MFNRVVSAVVMGLALVADAAHAAESRPVRLTWKEASPQQPGEIARIAQVPRATVVFTRAADGSRYLRLSYSDGTMCSTAASRDETDRTVSFGCGTKSSYYFVGHAPGGLPTLEWIGAGDVGEKGN